MKKIVRIVGFLLGCVLSGFILWPVFQNMGANPEIRERVEKLVQEDARLKPLYDTALVDGKLSRGEAVEIANKAKEIKGK